MYTYLSKEARELLAELILFNNKESEDMLKLLQEKVEDDDSYRGVIGELAKLNLINILWGNGQPCEVVINRAGKIFFEKEKESLRHEEFLRNVRGDKVEINGNSNNIQIQQHTNNSGQTMNINKEFDYSEIDSVINEIKKCRSQFNDIYGEQSERISTLLDLVSEMIKSKEEPNKIKKHLYIIKEITVKVGSSLIATGILGLLSKLGI